MRRLMTFIDVEVIGSGLISDLYNFFWKKRGIPWKESVRMVSRDSNPYSAEYETSVVIIQMNFMFLRFKLYVWWYFFWNSWKIFRLKWDVMRQEGILIEPISCFLVSGPSISLRIHATQLRKQRGTDRLVKENSCHSVEYLLNLFI